MPLATTSDNQKWGSTPVSPATALPTGAETAPVIRPILRKTLAVVNYSPPAANAIYNSPWFDTQADGTVSVNLAWLIPVAAGANSVKIHQSDDQVNVLIAFQITPTTGTLANSGAVAITSRYWRVQFTNGATPQTSTFTFTATATNAALSTAVTNPLGTPLLTAFLTGSTASDGQVPVAWQANVTGSTNTLQPVVVTAAITDTTHTAFIRTPNIFKTANATASGNTALWTPAGGKKFRLMRYRVMVQGNAAFATTAGTVTVTLQDAAVATGICTHVIFVPSPAGTGPTLYISPWIDLGNGFISAAANNALNMNLALGGTGALSGGVWIDACGTEE